MASFRTIPTTVEAVRYVGPEEDLSQTRVDRQTLEEWGAPVQATLDWGQGSEGEWELLLDVDGETVRIFLGDWVIRELVQLTEEGPQYRYTALSNDDFQSTYESFSG